MTYHFDEHTPRYLFFAPGEEVRVTIHEEGPHALGRVSALRDKDPGPSARSVAFDLDATEGFMPIQVDAALSGTMADFLGSRSRVRVRFEGSKGTRYEHALRSHAGTGRWTYLAMVKEPGPTWYVCSNPCKDWKPTRSKPDSDVCCKTGVVIAVNF